MSKGNMFESVFEKPVAESAAGGQQKAAQPDQLRETAEVAGLFIFHIEGSSQSGSQGDDHNFQPE